jgi:O-antigen ligase
VSSRDGHGAVGPTGLLLTPPLLAFFASLPFHRPPVTTRLGPALALPEILFLVLTPVLALTLMRGGAWRTMPRAGFGLALLLMAGLAPSVLLAGDRRRALLQLAVLVYVAMIHEVALTATALGLRLPALRALVAGAAGACVLGLVATFIAWGGGDPGHLALVSPWTPLARPVGPTESPNMLALIALAGSAATLALARARALPVRVIAALVGLFALTLMLSQSRVLLAAVAGAGAALFAARVGVAGRTPRRMVAGVSGLILSAGAVGVLVLSLWFRLLPLRLAPPFIDTDVSLYRVIHETAWSTFRAHPLAGVGLENFHRAWPAHYDPTRHDAMFNRGLEVYLGRPWDPHGTLQGYLAEGGLPGLAAVLVVAALVWRRRDGAPETLGLLVALGCALFFNDLLTERSTFATLGLLLSTSAQPPIPPSHPPGTSR